MNFPNVILSVVIVIPGDGSGLPSSGDINGMCENLKRVD